MTPSTCATNLPHPLHGDYLRGERMDTLEGAVSAHLNKGDALLFVDGMMHGGSSRTNEGRRILIYDVGIHSGERFNLISARRSDPNSHTWKITNDELMRNR
ncbi:hypothetical protein ABN034_22470 [Actinopolymorpha sp. B11F2]|uniref:hypothetical protein n=1 Tax=Actinopolymorpha sp. B11F2 TaxID=3160862 RepID=UPI0032E3CCD5